MVAHFLGIPYTKDDAASVNVRAYTNLPAPVYDHAARQ